MSAHRRVAHASQLRRTRRMVSTFDQTSVAMCAGEHLQLQYENGRPRWSLSNGQPVSTDVAGMIINVAGVERLDVGLLADLQAQTFRLKQRSIR